MTVDENQDVSATQQASPETPVDKTNGIPNSHTSSPAIPTLDISKVLKMRDKEWKKGEHRRAGTPKHCLINGNYSNKGAKPRKENTTKKIDFDKIQPKIDSGRRLSPKKSTISEEKMKSIKEKWKKTLQSSAMNAPSAVLPDLTKVKSKIDTGVHKKPKPIVNSALIKQEIIRKYSPPKQRPVSPPSEKKNEKSVVQQGVASPQPRRVHTPKETKIQRPVSSNKSANSQKTSPKSLHFTSAERFKNFLTKPTICDKFYDIGSDFEIKDRSPTSNFRSLSPRFSTRNLGADSPGPGKYEAKIPEKKICAIISTSPRFDYPEHKHVTPGPGDYSPLYNHRESRKIRPSSPFETRTKRFQEFHTRSTTPPPGAYDVTPSWIKPTRSLSPSFASSSPRFEKLTHARNPSPQTYNVNTSTFVKKSFNVSMGTFGSSPRPCILKYTPKRESPKTKKSLGKKSPVKTITKSNMILESKEEKKENVNDTNMQDSVKSPDSKSEDNAKPATSATAENTQADPTTSASVTQETQKSPSKPAFLFGQKKPRAIRGGGGQSTQRPKSPPKTNTPALTPQKPVAPAKQEVPITPSKSLLNRNKGPRVLRGGGKSSPVQSNVEQNVTQPITQTA